MFARLVAWSLSQRLLVAMLCIGGAVAGVVAWRELPVDAFPDVSSTQVKIIYKAPGMTPEEVEQRIAVPIELEMLGLPHKRVVRSVSKYAIVDITIDFDDGTDVYWARQQVSERLGSVAGDLPAGVEGGLAPITTPLGEMLMFTVESDAMSLQDRRTLLDWTIRPALRTLAGVADVNVLGGEVRSFEVVPDLAAMQVRGVSHADLERALRGNNRNDGAGRLTQGEESLLVRAEGAIRDLDDLRAVVIAGHGAGGVVRLGDVAQVRIGSLTRYGAVNRDGRGEAVQGLVLGLAGANARRVVESVRARLAELAPTLPPGVRLDVFYDRGQLVDRAIATVQRALLEAVVLVVVLLLAFLGNLRAALVVAVTLPMSALLAFVAMRVAGMSANLMSLGGLAIAIGMLVDASVVVVENVVSRLAGYRGDAVARLALVRDAVCEVATPVVSGVSIIVVVFLPLLTLEGLEGKMFRPVALSIVFALTASLIVALTLIPVLAASVVRGSAHRQPWLVAQLERGYRPLLAAALARPAAVLGVAALLLVAALAGLLLVGKTFMPTMDEGDIIVQLEKLPSVSLEHSSDLDGRIQRRILASVPEVAGVVARLGADEIGLDPMGLNESDAFLVLKPAAEWRSPDKEAIVESLRAVLEAFPGVSFGFTQPIEMRVSEMLTGTRGDLAVKIFGTDHAVLTRLADAIRQTISEVPGAQDVFTARNAGVQYFRVSIDRLRAGRMGLDVDDVQDALRLQFEGRRVGTVLESGRRTPLLLRGGDALRNDPARLSRLVLTLPDGRSVPLSDVALLERAEGPVRIEHENGSRMSVVRANVEGRDLVGFVEDARRAVEREVPLPPGVRLAWGGQFENQQRAAARLALVVPVALVAIFVLLQATFASVRQALLVLANVPFALIGGVFGLWISGEYLSVPASVGFIALLGIAVLNGVVLVSHFNQLLAEGLPLREAIVEGAVRRLRPVAMTASIAAFGLLPLLFARGPGTEIQRPLAIVVIGGLVSATALTLLLLPLLYERFGVNPALRGGASAIDQGAHS